MITTNETEEELREKGWVPLWGVDTRELEAAGVPMKLAPAPPENGSGVWTTVAMAPRWAVVLVADWAISSGLLGKAVREVYRHPDEKQTELAEAILAAMRLGGFIAVTAILAQAEKDRRP
jgi:hypothetical protein